MEAKTKCPAPRILAALINNSQIEGKISMPFAGDISAVPYIRLSGERFCFLTDEALRSLGLEKADTMRLAIANTCKENYVVDRIQNILTSLAPDMAPPAEDAMPILVVTNQMGLFGAAGLFLNPAVRKQVYAKLGDFFVLPSSIHELLCIPKDAGNPKDLAEMVRSINASLVDEKEVLSNEVFVVDSALVVKPVALSRFRDTI